MVAKADYTHHIHAFQHPSFPKAKEPMDVNDHEHNHNITTEHEGGTKLDTEHHGMSTVKGTMYHLNKGHYKGTTVTSKKTYHG